MKIMEVKTYKFDELSDDAKEKAREWYREGIFDYEWYEHVYEDANNIGLKIEECDIDHNTIKGKLLMTAKESAEKIIKDHGDQCDTYILAKDYLKEIKKITNEDEIEKAENEFRHALLECYLSSLRKEVEYMLSDDYADEGISSNEYNFTESGKRSVAL